MNRPSVEAVTVPHPPNHPNEEVIRLLNGITTTPYKNSFASRLGGTQETEANIVVDWDTVAPWMKLMSDIRQHYVLSKYAYLGESIPILTEPQ